MAVYNVPNYLTRDGFGMTLNIRRGNPNPLDNSSVWSSYDAAWNYAKTDVTAYVGQVLSVVNVDKDGKATSVDVYKIDNEAGDLAKVGTSPVGDESTITVAENGTVSLYGIAGLPLTREDDEGKVTNITYQPLYVNGKLTWVEPSATTVEGLASEIEGIKTRLSTLENTVGDSTKGLVKSLADTDAKIGEVTEGKTVVEMISDVEGKIPTVPTKVSEFENDSKYQTETDVSTAISTAISKINHAVFQKVDAVPDAADATDNVLYLVPAADGTHHDIYAKVDGAMVLIDDTDADLSGYAKTEDIQDELDKAHEHSNKTVLDLIDQDKVDAWDDASAKKHEHSNKTVLDAITEEKVAAWDEAEKNVIASVDETNFEVDADRKLTLKDIAMEKVTGLSDEFAGLADIYVAKEEGKVLSSNDFTDELKSKLEGIDADADVNVIEIIKIGESTLPVTDKTVKIPVAAVGTLGAVASSTDENKVAVATDGTMEVNSVNVNKLTQTTGESLILNGGSSAGFVAPEENTESES